MQFFLPLISTNFCLATEQLLILLNHDIPNEGVEINIPLVLSTMTTHLKDLVFPLEHKGVLHKTREFEQLAY